MNVAHLGRSQVGVATIAAAVQRAGGSTAHPGDLLDKALEQRAAYIEGGAGPEAASLGKRSPHPCWNLGVRLCMLRTCRPL